MDEYYIERVRAGDVNAFSYLIATRKMGGAKCLTHFRRIHLSDVEEALSIGS